MSEATMHVEASATAEAGMPAHRGRTRTCVGCGARVDVLGPDGADIVRLVLGPGGEIAVEGGSRGTPTPRSGRGLHVHARPACVERAARSGVVRATKGQGRLVAGGDPSAPAAAALSTDSLARAIQRSMDRRIEGLLAAAVRSRQIVHGADAVAAACQRGEAALVVVACDAAEAASLPEVRRAVAEGRAVAWGMKIRIGAIVAPAAARGRLAPSPDPSGDQGVVAITSRHIADALRQAVAMGDAVTMGDPERVPPTPPARMGAPQTPPARRRVPQTPPAKMGAGQGVANAAENRPGGGGRTGGYGRGGRTRPRGPGRPRDHRSDG